jgi:hypothetical protein
MAGPWHATERIQNSKCRIQNADSKQCNLVILHSSF